MKKSGIIVLLVFLLGISTQIITAAPSLNFSGTQSLEIGEKGRITLSTDELATFDGSVSNSNSDVLRLDSTSDYYNGTIAGDGSATIVVVGLSEGVTTVYASGTVYTENGPSPFSASISVTVNAPYIEPETPSNPEVPSNPETPSTPKPETPSKTPEEIANEKEEAELKAKEEALELAKKTPLFTKIELISRSDKRGDMVLTEITTVEDTFTYEYTLPKKIDKFEVKLTGDEGIELTYDKDHVFGADELKKEIAITAKGPEFTQEFVLTVLKNVKEDTSLVVDNVPLTVYEDELLDELMVARGFKLSERIIGELKSPIYTYGDVNVQLLVDAQQNAKWYILGKENVPLREVVIVMEKEKQPLFIYDADNVELTEKTLYGGEYKSNPFTVDEELIKIDSSLKFKTNFMAWDFEDGKVVYGFNTKMVDDLYFIGADKDVKAAIVAYDAAGSNKMIKTLAIASTTGFIVLAAYLLATTILNIRKRKLLEDKEAFDKEDESSDFDELENTIDLDDSEEHDESEKTL